MMATKHAIVKFKFSHIKFATDIRAAMMFTGLNAQDVAALAGCSDTTVSMCASNNNPNPLMATWLGIANALDLNALDYIELEY